MDTCGANFIIFFHPVHPIVCTLFEIKKKYLHCFCFHYILSGLFDETERDSTGVCVDGDFSNQE
jgi:hypothetical protein